MKQKQILALALALSILSLTVVTVHGYSDGPLDGHTGGDGEPSCAKSGCHDNAEPNTGGGDLFITAPSSYIPGEKYDIPVQSAGFSDRNGFLLKAVDKSGNSAGNFTIVDEEITQLSEKGGMVYVKQTKKGTERLDWILQWIAPPAGTGTVTFYGASVAANNDSTSDHDNVYTAWFESHEEVDGDDDDPGFGLVATITAVSFMALIAGMKRRKGPK